MSEVERHSDYVKKSIEAGGFVGYGPFRIGGSYGSGSETNDMQFHQEGASLVIPGIQLIGFVNNLIPQSPNPNPDIKPDEFVGGE
jgi:hypothetical protein